MSDKEQKPEDLESHLAPETVSALENLGNEVEPDESDQVQQGMQMEVQTKADQAQAEQARKNKAMMSAMGTVALLEKGVKKKWDFVVIENETKGELVDALAPVFEKRDVSVMPEWLQPYKEEFMAFCALGGAAFGIYLQIKEHEEAAAKVEASKGEGKGTTEKPAPGPVETAAAPAANEGGKGEMVELGNLMQEPV